MTAVTSRGTSRLDLRRSAGWAKAHRQRRFRATEADFLIDFARTWAPYGGATEEDILVHFGMTWRRFVEHLWQVIPQTECTEEEIRSFATVYRLGT
ncbi:MAG: hypothetical protein AAGC80_21730 [Rhodococcus sp. (in: high G+C Gram-positive bacteria)]